MTYFNPIAGSYATANQVARVQSETKDRQLQRAEALRKNSAAASDRLEHEVESSDAVHLQEDEPQQQRQQRPPKKRKPSADAGDDDDKPSIDLRA